MAIPTNIGKYRVERRLGEGGMGTVYLAHDEGIDRHVAIKLLRADDDDMRRRFRGEARSVGRLKHPNIVTVYDYSDFEGSPCIVMEYVEGETLAGLIKRGDPFPDARKLQLIEQVCRGLAYAHRAGIVHRDIKPSNLMVDHEGTIKIVDFGIARTGERGLTLTGKVVGTLAYMAPEQARGEPVDRRSDIFAVGLVLYEFLCGRSAFPGDSDYSIINRIVTGDPEPFRHPDAALSELIIPVIDIALAKAPDKRYQDADQLATALAGVRTRLESHPKLKETEVPSSIAVVVPSRVQEPVATGYTEAPTVPRTRVEDLTVKLPGPSPSIPVRPRADVEAKPEAALSDSADARPPMPSVPSRRSRWMIVGPAIAAVVVLAVTYLPFGGTQSGEFPVPDSTPVRPVDTGSAPPTDVPTPTPVAPVPPSVQPTPPKVAADQRDTAPRPTPVKIDKPASDKPARDFTARLAEASRLFEEGDYAAAVSVYEAILAEDPRNPAATRGLGTVKRAQATEENFVRGAVAPRALNDEENRQVARHLAEAKQRHGEGEYDAAIAAYGAALKIDPRNAGGMAGLAETRKAQAAEAAVLGGLKKKPGA